MSQIFERATFQRNTGVFWSAGVTLQSFFATECGFSRSRMPNAGQGEFSADSQHIRLNPCVHYDNVAFTLAINPLRLKLEATGEEGQGQDRIGLRQGCCGFFFSTVESLA